MLSQRTVSLWILIFGMVFATMSANPVVVYPMSPASEPVRADSNPDHNIHQAGIPDGARSGPSVIETEVHHVDDQDVSVFDDENDDDRDFELDDDEGDDFVEMDDEMAMEEEIYRKLEGSTVPKRVVKMMKEISEDDEFMDGKGNTVRSYMPLKSKSLIFYHNLPRVFT